MTCSVTGGSDSYILAHGAVNSPYNITNAIDCIVYNSKDGCPQPQTVNFQVDFFLSSGSTPGISEFDFRCY